MATARQRIIDKVKNKSPLDQMRANLNTTPVSSIQKLSNMNTGLNQVGPQLPQGQMTQGQMTQSQIVTRGLPDVGISNPVTTSIPAGRIPPTPNVMQGLQTGLVQPVQNVGENRVNTAIQGIENTRPFDSNLENDPAFRAARDASLTAIKNRMGAAGRLYSGKTDQLMMNAAMEVGLPFRQQSFREYQDSVNQGYDKLNAFAGAEDRIRNQEISQYGTALTPVARQYKTVYESMPPQMLNQVRAYQQDYAAEILRREAIDPNDPLLPYLYSARTMKILSSPELMGRYAQDIGISSPKIAEMALLYDAQVMKNEADKLVAKYADKTIQAEYEKLMAEVERAVYEKDIKGIEKLMKDLEYSNLPEELANKIKEGLADIAYKNAQAYAQTEAGNLSKARQTTETADQLKKLAEMDKIKNEAKKAENESFDYKGFAEFDKFIQDNYMEDFTSVVDIPAEEASLNEDGTGFVGNPYDRTQTTKTKKFKEGAREAVSAYLSRLRANPNVDQDIVDALLAKYPTIDPNRGVAK